MCLCRYLFPIHTTVKFQLHELFVVHVRADKNFFFTVIEDKLDKFTRQ